jgi:hypothetical protein
MSNNIYGEAYEIAMNDYNSALIDQEAAYRQAELAGDARGMAIAHQHIANLRVQQDKAHQIAVQHANSMRQPQRHPSGLSNEEIEVAKASHSGGTEEERIRSYAQQKAKLQHMRMTGEYRDDQGSVRR